MQRSVQLYSKYLTCQAGLEGTLRHAALARPGKPKHSEVSPDLWLNQLFHDRVRHFWVKQLTRSSSSWEIESLGTLKKGRFWIATTVSVEIFVPYKSRCTTSRTSGTFVEKLLPDLDMTVLWQYIVNMNKECPHMVYSDMEGALNILLVMWVRHHGSCIQNLRQDRPTKPQNLNRGRLNIRNPGLFSNQGENKYKLSFHNGSFKKKRIKVIPSP